MKKSTQEEAFLETYKLENYDRPSLTVDNILFVVDEVEGNNVRKLNKQRLQVLLVKRKEHPYINQYALIGTFLKMDETLEQASKRCLETKANIKDAYVEQLYTFASIDRDPRARVVSVAYMGLVDKQKARTLDSKQGASWFTLTRETGNIILENEQGLRIHGNELAFDHGIIIEKGLERLINKLEYTDLAFELVGEPFTLAQLQQVYELILDKKLTKANFQRKIVHKIIDTNEYQKGGYRPAKLYIHKK